MRLSADEARKYFRTGMMPIEEKQPEKKERGTAVFNIRYQGKILSNNEMKSLHWRKLKKIVDPIKKEMRRIISRSGAYRVNRVMLIIEYNSRHDVDNVTATGKIFMDTFVELGFLPDDKKKHWPRTSTEWFPELPHNTIDFTVIELN